MARNLQTYTIMHDWSVGPIYGGSEVLSGYITFPDQIASLDAFELILDCYELYDASSPVYSSFEATATCTLDIKFYNGQDVSVELDGAGVLSSENGTRDRITFTVEPDEILDTYSSTSQCVLIVRIEDATGGAEQKRTLYIPVFVVSDDGTGEATPSAATIAYTPAVGADWIDPDPDDVAEGLDDLADRVANLNTEIVDTNQASIIILSAAATSVNEITVTNAATGNAPDISATGDDAAVGLTMGVKGVGDITLTSGNDITLKTGVAASDIGVWQAYDVDGSAYDSIITVTSGNTPTLTLQADGGATINAGLTLSDAAGTGAAVVGAVGTTDITITSGHLLALKSGVAAGATVAVQGYDVDASTYDSVLTVGSGDPTFILQGDGGGTINAAVVMSDAAGSGAGLMSGYSGQGMAIRTGAGAADALNLQAYDVDASTYDTVIALTGGNTPTVAITGDGGVTVYPTGGTKIGNASHYSEFEADGTLVFNGDATVWQDITLGGIALGNPAGAPDVITWGTTAIEVYGFDGGGATESLHGAIEIPHSYKEGTDITPHVHFAPVDTNAGTVVWQLEYEIREGTTVVSSTTINTSEAVDGVAWKGQEATFSAITGTDINIGDSMIFRLFRDSNHGSDNYESDAALLNLGLSHEVDTVGSRQIETK